MTNSDNRNSSRHLTIIGGGLVGALLSIVMAKRGYRVDVYEKRSDYRASDAYAGRSINLALSDRGWNALRAAGIGSEIESVAIPMYGRMMHDLNGELTYQPYGKSQQAIYSVSRGGLNRRLVELADSLPNVNFHFDQECEKIDLENSQIWWRNTKTGETQQQTYDLACGSDGAFSVLRSTLQKTNRFDYSQTYLEHSYKELHIPAGANGKFLMEKNALHIWPRHQFMLIALPNLDGSFTCTLFLAHEADSHSQEAFNRLQTESDVRAFVEKYFADAIPLMPDYLSVWNQNPVASLVTVRCSPWVYGKNLFLIGDAAHAIVPFYGQGMNAGFEDCFVLNQILDECQDNWEKVLPLYQQKRVKEGNAIADLALANFIEMRDKVAEPMFLLRKKIEARIHELFPNDWLPLYSMVTFSPQIPYSEALRIGKLQDDVMSKVMQQPNIAHEWHELNFGAIVKALQQKLQINV
ncbi:MAG: FAD-dependent monooxygenase [Cytophagales bacterium]|nr:MAG: FAD-dependent monooxygenase [Cytophagales bacterium]TAF62291.1 MAG: FAD-dependent monooxygenase [Cytophagales bacterium]